MLINPFRDFSFLSLIEEGLDLLTTVCAEQGIVRKRVSAVTMHHTLKRWELSEWTRAKAWIVSPNEQYPLKKHQCDRLIRLSEQHSNWALGFLDEVWWSQLQLPQLHSWTERQSVVHQMVVG